MDRERWFEREPWFEGVRVSTRSVQQAGTSCEVWRATYIIFIGSLASES
jgi:hypothetical protein